MKKKDKFKFSKEQKDVMIAKIKKYYQDEKDEEISDLASSLMLDFIINELASEFYNQGVYDSYKYMNERCEDLLGIQL